MNFLEKIKLITEKLGPELKDLATTKRQKNMAGGDGPLRTSIPTQGDEYVKKRPLVDKHGKPRKPLSARAKAKYQSHKARAFARQEKDFSGGADLPDPHEKAGWERTGKRIKSHGEKRGVKKERGAKPSEEATERHRAVKRTAAIIRRQQKPGWESPHITQMRKDGKLKSS